MGNLVSSANPAAVGIDSYVSELTDVQYERRLASNSDRLFFVPCLTRRIATSNLSKSGRSEVHEDDQMQT